MPDQDQPPKSPRKQPAKKAAAATPRDSIFNRIAELEERISAEPPRKALPAEQLAADAPPKPPAPKRPAAKKPAQRPVKKAVPGAVKAPVPGKARAPEVQPMTEAPPEAPVPPAVAKPARKAVPPEPVVTELDGPPVFDQQAEQVVTPAPAELATAPRVLQSREHPPTGTSFLPFVAGLIVVLLAVAVGLGAAAAARSQPATWSSSSVVTLAAVSPGASASAVPAGVDRYQERANGPSFTAVVAFQAGVKPRALVKAKDGAGDQVVLEAKASTKAGAAKLAAAAGRALVMAVTASEAQVADQSERLAAVTTLASDPERETPTTRHVWLAGTLAALAFLLVAAMVALLAGSRKDSQETARGSRR